MEFPPVTEAAELDDLALLQAVITEAIRAQSKTSEIEALPLADAVIGAIRRDLGGARLYISGRLSLLERAARDKAVRAEYDGRNGADVCKRHAISKAQLHRIIGRQPAVSSLL